MGRPQRVAVVGYSGSGKSALVRELARRLGAEHIELDAIHHPAHGHLDWVHITSTRQRQEWLAGFG